MSDWKEQLNNKEKELKLGKEEVDEVKSRSQNRSSSSRGINSISDNKNTTPDSNSIGSRSRDLLRRRIPERTGQINKDIKKGGKGMITLEAVLSDIEKIEKDDNMSEQKKLFAVVKVIMKFLSTMRSNQLLTEEDKKRIATDKAKRAVENKEKK